MADPAVYPGPQFWEQVRREFARTEVSSVEAFNRDEMPWLLARFSMTWGSLERLDDTLPHARFAPFEALAGYRSSSVVIDGGRERSSSSSSRSSRGTIPRLGPAEGSISARWLGEPRIRPRNWLNGLNGLNGLDGGRGADATDRRRPAG